MSAKPDMGQKLFVQLSMQYNQVKQSNSGCQRMLENFDIDAIKTLYEQTCSKTTTET